jgi:hypothetical protein
VVKIKHIIIALFIVGIGAVAFVFFFQSEESKVKRQFKSLSEKVSKEPGEKKLAMALKAKQLYAPRHVQSCAYRLFTIFKNISEIL